MLCDMVFQSETWKTKPFESSSFTPKYSDCAQLGHYLIYIYQMRYLAQNQDKFISY